MGMWKRPEDMSFQDFMSSHYATFEDTIRILKATNGLLPELTDKYARSSFEKWLNKFKNLNEEGRRQLKAVWEKPMDDSLTLTDHTAIDIYCSGMEVLVHPHEIARIIMEMSLVYLISAFESYLENVIALILSRRPEMLKSEKTITHEEVIEIAIGNGTMEDLIRNFKDKYISSIMREDIDKILKILSSKPFKLSEIIPEASDWRRLKESFYRRHIIIHNRGYTDSQYEIRSGYKGQQKKLFIDKKYLAKRFETFQRCSGLIRDSANTKFGAEKELNQLTHFDMFNLNRLLQLE